MLHMLRISLFGLFYSVYQIPVNEAPFLSVDPGLEIDDLSTDAFEQSFELGYAPFFLLFSAWLLAYRKLQKEPGTFRSESPEIGVAPAAKGSPKFSPREVPGQTCPPPKAAPKCPPRAKAKGKAPPPKGTPPRKATPASKTGEATPAKAAANPFGARRVRWRALQSAAGTIFDGLGTGQLRNETARMLNEVFRVTPQGQSAKSSPFIPKSSGVCLLNPKRAQQLAIVFRRSPVPLQKLCSALLALDFSVLGHLGEEEVDGLLQAWPTSFDFQLVEKYTGPIQELRDVEQCIKQMSAVPRSEARLKLLRLSRSLDGLGHFLEQFELLRCACEELLASKTLRLLLEEALTMGNYINGDAGAGFSLDAFSHLKSLKGAAGTTALHCLCASCAQEDPDFCSKLAAELRSLRSASQISLGTLNEALQCIKTDVESAAMEFANHAGEYNSTPAIAELEELPPAPIQPLGSAKLGLPCKIPPLHLQMLQSEPSAAQDCDFEPRGFARYQSFILCIDLLRKHAFAPPKGISQRLPGETGYDPEKDRISTLMALCTANPDRAPFVSRSNWRSKVLAVDLQGVGLTDLRFLAELPECQFLCLSDNEIPNLDWLPPLQKLESLHLERCNLTSLRGIARCQELQKLEAGGNHLTDALELQKLSKLSQVSLEDNFVDSLDTFAQLSCLMELYLSNNVIEELRSLLLLKQLPKLLVLDLAGNDLCKASDYRQYAMFHLRKLKVLDGIPLSKAEQQQADEKFSGKVTMELLEDKLGPSPSCYTFRTVDLSSQGIREIGQLINDDLFPSLRELVLDGNPITDIRNLGPLVKLLVLRLNKTKLDLEGGVLGGAEFTGGFGTFPNLQVLELGYSCIADMRVFSELPLQSLRILHLPGNEISKLEGLNKMEQLRELVLDKNRVKQFDEKSFEGLRALRELRVEDNGLKSLSNMSPLPRLRALYLSLNRIVELSELEKLRPLRHLLVVHMAQNPVARKPQYRLQLLHCVPTARAVDGREVTPEERERLDQVAFMDGGKTAAVYVFNDPPPSNVQVTFMSPPVATVQVPGGPVSDPAKATPGAERDRRSSQGQVELDLSGLKKDRAQSARKTVPNPGPGR
eukprot:s894_g31.t1